MASTPTTVPATGKTRPRTGGSGCWSGSRRTAWREAVRRMRTQSNPGMFGQCRLIDLSVSLEDNAVSEPMPARIRYVRHDGEGLRQMQQYLGVKPEDLVWSNGLGWALE